MKENDKQRQEYNKQLLIHAQKADWGLYRNTRYEMAELLEKENRLGNALEIYLEICYLDLNGPMNCGGRTKDMFDWAPIFDPKIGLLAPGIVYTIKQIIQKIEPKKNIQELFINHNKIIQRALKLPLGPEKCWPLVEKELKK